MYEKKNKWTQTAPMLGEIMVWLRKATHRNINEKCAIFL